MGDITIRKALDDYKTVYMAYRNFADRTREEYLNDLRDFVGYAEKRGIKQVEALGLPIIERYVAHLDQNLFASQTRKRKVVAIRSYLSYLYQEGYIHNNIAKMVVLPFAVNTTPHVLTQRECDRLRDVCRDNTRDRAIVEVFLQTGIKLSELVRLTVDDIDLGKLQNGLMRIRESRGKKERMIPLNSKASVSLRDHLSQRDEEESKTLFTNRFGQALGERGVQKMLRKYIRKAGIDHATIQTLRHTFGALHMIKGTSLKTVQEVMGLKDIKSTSIYQSLAKSIMSRELQVNSI